MSEETPTIEEDACVGDCYICHPGRPLPWWAFQTRRIKVMNRVTVALSWLERSRTSTPETMWQGLSSAEEAIRDAYNLMRQSNE